ncbi:MAG: UbiA prenyltransferase family protein [Sedimentisphaerales bacterium]|nr:UbiA prenyltransferase family protein [Sedimentisphaerales bacterium]
MTERKTEDTPKKTRPLAARRITIRSALSIGIILTTVGLLGSAYLDISALCMTILYLILNVFYTVKLKQAPFLDILIVAFGFVIRIIVGGVVTGIKVYPWIMIMTFLLALFLAMGKRRDDLLLFRNHGEKVRKSIDGYTMKLVDSSMLVLAAVMIVSYIIHMLSSEIISKFKTDYLYLTTVFVVLGIMRYLQIIFIQQSSADPVEILWKDSFIQIVIIGWITMFALLIYL